MITRILILLVASCVLGAEHREWMFNDKDVPEPTQKSKVTIHNTDKPDDLQNQNPPDNFPYENATVIGNNSILLNNNTENNNNSILVSNVTITINKAPTTNPVNEEKITVTPAGVTGNQPALEASVKPDAQATANNHTINTDNGTVAANSTNDSQKDNISTNISTESPITTLPPKPTDTEVSDMLNGSKIIYNNTNVVTVKYITDALDQPDKIIEFIGDNPEDTEDFIRIKQPVSGENTAVVQGQLAAVLAGVFVVIAIIGYIGLISWRKYLENRYRDRQMLVDDMEFNEREDTLYFSI